MRYEDLMPGVHYESEGHDLGGAFFMLNLGLVHGYTRTLKHYPRYKNSGKPRTVLLAGCHIWASENAARDYWKSGKNPEGVARPHAKASIDYAAALCAVNGWKW